MTNSELKNKIAESKNPQWYNDVKEVFNFNYVDTVISLQGVAAIYEYVNQQIDGWSQYEQLPNEFTNSKKYFNSVKSQIIQFINNAINQSEATYLNSYWSSVKNTINNTGQRPIPYNVPQTEFLINLFINNPNYFQGAYGFIILSNYNLNDKNQFLGALIGYEFIFKDKSEIFKRRNAENNSLAKIRNDLQGYLSDSDRTLVEHLTNINLKFQEYSKKIDDLKTEKEDNFNTWFESTKKDNWGSWYESTVKKISDLEFTYREKLKLEEPAKYWNDRAKDLKKQGWKALAILVILVLISCWSLGKILWTAPEEIYTSWFGNDKSAAIRWSIIYITLISFIAFCIRAVTKVMFSSFHLARDSEERYTLTYFYLSLLKDSNVNENDRQLIMQSLFSRAETGLLKDDSSPTMPNDIVSKFITK